MTEQIKKEFENEFISILLSAMEKGMTSDEFFAMANATMSHLRGKIENETVAKIMDNSASPQEVEKMIAELTRQK